MNYQSDIPSELARHAFANVSMNPEGRGRRAVEGYAAELAEDYEVFKAAGIKGGTVDLVDEQFARYRAGYAKRYNAWLHSASRCISSFITGPSNFPVARAQKRNAIEHNRLNDIIAFREIAKRAAMRVLRPDLRPIMAGDADATDRLAVEIAKAEKLQERMKAANKALRAAGADGKDAQVAVLIEMGFAEDAARDLVFPRFSGGQGYPSFRLTNNQANIRRMRARLEQIERAQAKPVVEKVAENGTRLEDDPPANRVRLFFTGKPEADVRTKLKGNGFRWTPSLGAWQAYRNSNTLNVAACFVAA